MFDLEEMYKQIKKERKEICSEIVELEKCIDVMKYKNLKNKNIKLKEQEEVIYRVMKLEEYDKCSHILVITDESKQTSTKGNFEHQYCGCIKCGLDQKISKYLTSEVEKLKLEQRVQYEYLHKHQFHINGKETGINCSIDLGHNIYKDIINKNIDKELTDDEIIELFKETYNDMNKDDKPKVKEKINNK